MAHNELDLRKRRAIEYMLNAKKPVRKIAAEIGRHVSTTYRDIKRNGYTDTELPELNRYYGVVAQRSAAQRRARRLKLVPFVDLRKAMIKQLKEGWFLSRLLARCPVKVKLCVSATRRSRLRLLPRCAIKGTCASPAQSLEKTAVIPFT